MIGMPKIPDFKGLATAGQATGTSFGGAALLGAVFGKQWAIVNEFGVPVLLVDSVLSFAYDNNSTISHFPVEKGSFASYNKVDNPYLATVQLAKSTGGTLQRGLFLTQLETLKKSTLKFHVITPEYVYMNASIISTSLVRDANDGCTLLKVNVELEEIREAEIEYDFEEVKAPSDSTTKDGGSKQGQDKSNDTLLKQGVDFAKGMLGL